MIFPFATRRLSLVLLVLVATGGVVGLRFAGAHWSRGERFDLMAVQEGSTQVAAPRAQHATAFLLNTISIASLVFVGAGFIGFAVLRGRRDLAAACTLLLVGAPVTTELLKSRLKPHFGGPSQLANSYPSGHSTIALAVGLGLVLVAPAALRLAAAAAGALYATAVGTALVVTASHYPSDVAGGFCVATAWAAAAAVVAGRPVETRLPGRLLAAVVLLVTAAAAAALVTHPGIVVRLQLHIRLMEAALGIAAVAATCTAAFAYVIAARSASATRS